MPTKKCTKKLLEENVETETTTIFHLKQHNTRAKNKNCLMRVQNMKDDNTSLHGVETGWANVVM